MDNIAELQQIVHSQLLRHESYKNDIYSVFSQNKKALPSRPSNRAVSPKRREDVPPVDKSVALELRGGSTLIDRAGGSSKGKREINIRHTQIPSTGQIFAQESLYSQFTNESSLGLFSSSLPHPNASNPSVMPSVRASGLQSWGKRKERAAPSELNETSFDSSVGASESGKVSFAKLSKRDQIVKDLLAQTARKSNNPKSAQRRTNAHGKLRTVQMDYRPFEAVQLPDTQAQGQTHSQSQTHFGPLGGGGSSTRSVLHHSTASLPFQDGSSSRGGAHNFIPPFQNSLSWTSKSAQVEVPRNESMLRVSPGINSTALMDELMRDIQELSIETSHRTFENSSNNLNTLNEWKSIYESEGDQYSFESLLLYAEMRYLEMKEKEKDRGTNPTKVKAAICANLLIKISKYLGRYARIIQPLIWELLNCIFFEYAERFPAYSVDRSATDLLDMSTYFDKYLVVLEAFEDVSAEVEMIKAGIKMKDVVKKFQTVTFAFDHAAQFIRNSCFHLWKKFYKRNHSYIKKCYKKRLLYRFRSWQNFVATKKKRFFDDFNHELDDKIARLNELTNLIRTHNTTVIRADADNPNLILFNNDIMTNPQMQFIERNQYISQKDAQMYGTKGPQQSTKVILPPQVEQDINAANGASLIASASNAAASAVTSTATAQGEEAGVAMGDDVVGKKSLQGESVSSPSAVVAAMQSTAAADTDESELTGNISRTESSYFARQATRRSFIAAQEELRETLSSMTIGTPKGASGGISEGQGLLLGDNNRQNQGQGQGQVVIDGARARRSSLLDFENSALAKETNNALQQLSVLTGQLLCPSRHQTTQTPPDWEVVLPAHLKRNKAGGGRQSLSLSEGTSAVPGAGTGRMNLPSDEQGEYALSDNGDDDAAIVGCEWVSRESGGPIGGGGGGELTAGQYSEIKEKRLQRQRTNKQLKGMANKMNVNIACQLIAYIYEAKVLAIRSDGELQKFSKAHTLHEYTKEALNVKYGIKTIAQKHLAGFLNCCEYDFSSNKRIEIYAMLLGNNASGRKFDPDMCNFYFNMLNHIFDSASLNPKMIAITFNSLTRDIDRQDILEALKPMFPSIDAKDPDLFKNLVEEVLHVPASKGSEAHKTVFKIDIDEVLGILLEYYEFEKSLATDDYIMDASYNINFS